MECWSYCSARALRHSTTPSLHRSLALRLAGRVADRGWAARPDADRLRPVVGQDRQSNPATNAAATRLQAERRPTRPPLRPGVQRTTLPPRGRCRERRRARPTLPPWQPQREPAAKTNAAANRGADRRQAPTPPRPQARRQGLPSTFRNLQANRAFYPAVGVVVRLPVSGGGAGGQAVEGEGRQGAAKRRNRGRLPKAAARPARRKAARSRHPFLQRAAGRRPGAAALAIRRPGPGVCAEPRADQLCRASRCRPNSSPRIGARCGSASSTSPGCRRSRSSCAWRNSRPSDFDETLAMVELQLEKLSPMPVTQIVWSIQVLPHAEGNLQTVIVMIVSRNDGGGVSRPARRAGLPGRPAGNAAARSVAGHDHHPERRLDLSGSRRAGETRRWWRGGTAGCCRTWL